MGEFWKHLANIIAEGAESFYGLISLGIVAVSIVGVVIFRRESPKIKVVFFITMIICIISFLIIGHYSIEQGLSERASLESKDGCIESRENLDPKIQISIVKHNDENDMNLKNLFLEMVTNIKTNAPSFNYKGVRLRSSGYYDEPTKFEKNTISTIRPAQFASMMNAVDIIPIFAIKKEGQIEPYYQASFISAKESNIKDLKSAKDHVKRIYVCAKTSVSGYLAPIHELFEEGIIGAISEQAIKDIGWEIINVQNHDLVYQRVKQDHESIGATGLYIDTDPRKSEVTLVHQYGRFPQDVLVISKDLEDYKLDIQNWFENVLEKDNCKMNVLINSPARISGFTRMNNTLKRSYSTISQYHENLK
ncbi:MAG: PhnD/SsuA/transferrin family substrate-binding protein [Bacteroidota bacterium]